MMSKHVQKFKTWNFSFQFACRRAVVNLSKTNDEKYKKGMSNLGAWTKHSLIDLGPTFVKLGQVASTRSDIFAPEFLKELETLQDDTPSMMEDDLQYMLREELGTDGMDVFSDFNLVPWKSASLGQVHRATLVDGTDVCVKIQRRGVYEMVEEDTTNVIEVVDFMEKVGLIKGQSAIPILQDVKKYIFEELDYVNEASNTERFRKNFKYSDWLTVPRVYKPLVRNRLLVMEWIPGIKVSDVDALRANKINITKLCNAIVKSYVMQIMDHGFFHGDPHPGNMAVTTDGQLVFYDYGLCVEIPDKLSERTQDILQCVIDMNTTKLVDILIDIDIIIPTTKNKEEIAVFLDFLIRFLYDNSKKDFDMELMEALAQEKPFVFPSSIIFLFKSLVLVQGVCQNLDENFNLFQYIEPYVRETLSDTIDIGDIATQTIQIPARIKSISSSVQTLEKQKVAVKRSIDSNVQNLQLAILSATLSNLFLTDGNMVMFHVCFASFLIFLLRKP